MTTRIMMTTMIIYRPNTIKVDQYNAGWRLQWAGLTTGQRHGERKVIAAEL